MQLYHSINKKNEIISVMDGDTLQDLFIEFPDDLRPDTVCIAKVIGFANQEYRDNKDYFVKIGNKTAFLQRTKAFIRPDGVLDEHPLSIGEKLIVQVKHDKTENKEIKVSADICLAGEALVYTPTRQKKEFSKKIPQDKLKRLEFFLQPVQDSFIVRTLAQDLSNDAIAEELDDFNALWNNIISQSVSGNDILFEPEAKIFQVLKKYDKKIDLVITDHAHTAFLVKSAGHETKLYTDDIREHIKFPLLIEEALEKKIELNCGGSLIVEKTSCCVCFDVNSGKAAWAVANKQAAYEILRQIRIKNLSGQMIIDFAGKKDKDDLLKLIDILKNENLEIKGISNLGLVELIVRRGSQDLFDLKDTIL
ncbi:MAG: ribonuclease E/G [Alphaproteobacteria bacterium]|nr:ribonuclease E/G [Alphaproteobacteria bacterium]